MEPPRPREPEIVRAQALQRQEGADQAEIRSGGLLYRFGRNIVPLVGRFRWAQNAWLRQQRHLRHGVTEVKLRVPE